MSSRISVTPVNSPRQVLFASFVGTTIEYFDFYIYGTAAVLVFPALFFPATDPATATLASLATFGIAFLARPVGGSASAANGVARYSWPLRTRRPASGPGTACSRSSVPRSASSCRPRYSWRYRTG